VTATALLVPISTLYAGLLALLLLVAELNHAGPALLHACGAVLVVARVLHAMASQGPLVRRGCGRRAPSGRSA
jgi:uncharacterized membrane protein YecN with MAPEG domain